MVEEAKLMVFLAQVIIGVAVGVEPATLSVEGMAAEAVGVEPRFVQPPAEGLL